MLATIVPLVARIQVERHAGERHGGHEEAEHQRVDRRRPTTSESQCPWRGEQRETENNTRPSPARLAIAWAFCLLRGCEFSRSREADARLD